MAQRPIRPALPDLPPPRFTGQSDANSDDALKQRLRTVATEVGFGSRAGAAPAIPTAARPQAVLSQPAPSMKTLQLVIPDYLFEQLHMAAATHRVTKKYLVLQALRHAGYRIEDADLDEDGRRNR